MTYYNPYLQYPNGAYIPYQQPYLAALQQNYAQQLQAQQQMQQQPQQQQTITTQPPIMQPNAINSKILPVASKEEATGAQVDLITGTPSFFYNKSNGEIYLKQFDVPTGTAIFKVYGEITQSKEETKEPIQAVNYDKELHYIADGIDNLHRMQADLKQTIENLRTPDKFLYKEDEEIEEKPVKKKARV